MFKKGDWILVVHGDKRYFRRLDPSDSISVRGDVLRMRDVIGRMSGARIGNFQVFEPSLEDIIMLGFRRETQIVYPKDSFYIALRLGAFRGKRILEFGTGSGAMCAVLSSAGAEVHSFEVREKFYRLAKENLERFGLLDGVFLHHSDFASASLKDSFFDSAFVDVKDPIPYLDKLCTVLRDGGQVCFLLPTANQVSTLLRQMGDKFGCVEVLEILVRKYIPNPERFRPQDQMVGHTAFLLFARKLSDL